MSYCCPTKWKCSICILDHMLSTFFCLGKFLKWLANDQLSPITLGSIYYIICTCNVLVWKWIDMKFDIKMDVSTIFSICRCCVFTLSGSLCKLLWRHAIKTQWNLLISLRVICYKWSKLTALHISSTDPGPWILGTCLKVIIMTFWYWNCQISSTRT